ncbi:MAG: leucine-rich repeat domain-containing protein [Bacillota bacterium]|nr:leucine-rich repeat domain-containing protein [Bacillota bacterium]
MKKYQGFLMMLLVCLLVFSGAARADTLEEDIKALHEADSFDAQLALLNKIAVENAAELEVGSWDNDLNADAAPGLPEMLNPKHWDKVYADYLPEAVKGHKFIALYYRDGVPEPEIAGNFLARFPSAMRAKSLVEAEYTLIVRHQYVPSGYEYRPAATSYHSDYSAYVVDMKSGEVTRLWGRRNKAKLVGKIGDLNGEEFSQQEIWNMLRSYLFIEPRHTQADGTVLLFGINGENCYLKGFEGRLTVLDLPARVDGYNVTEICGHCFERNNDLTTVILPEGLKHIMDDAFSECSNLQSIELPNTLETIGERAFSHDKQLQRIVLPDSLVSIRNNAFFGCDKLARLVLGSGLTTLQETGLWTCRSLACCYVPASLTINLSDAGINEYTVIYAPEGSYALEWAAENGYRHVVCDHPDNMPDAEYITQEDFEFCVFNGEATLCCYTGKDALVTIPETAGGAPVTRIMYGAFFDAENLESLWLPKSVKTVDEYGVPLYHDGQIHAYIPGMETNLRNDSIKNGHKTGTLILHAPEGSLAQRYVTEKNSKKLLFEAWDGGGDDSGTGSVSDGSAVPGLSSAPDASSIADALKLAKKVQQNVVSFWKTCDRKEYAWLERVPGYDISKPEAAGVLRITQTQFDELALLLGGKDGVAAAFATIVNTQFSQPYAKAAEKTAQSDLLSPASDGSCAIVVLAYQTDIVLAVLQGDGSAQAALICSTPKIIQTLSPESILKIAADFGITEGECAVYRGDELLVLLNK